MSADNWGICPKCYKAVEYGKVSEAEYRKSLMDTRETLREDYEIYMAKDGVFRVSYGCLCNSCGFAFNYKHEEKP